MKKDEKVLILFIVLFALGSVGIVLYTQTNFFKNIIDFIVKVYNIMRSWFK